MGENKDGFSGNLPNLSRLADYGYRAFVRGHLRRLAGGSLDKVRSAFVVCGAKLQHWNSALPPGSQGSQPFIRVHFKDKSLQSVGPCCWLSCVSKDVMESRV